MRPKTQTRLSVLLLCLLLICLPAMGCGRKDSPAGESGSTPSPDGSATPLEQLPDKDMEGFEMTFLNYTDAAHGFSLKTIVPEESTTSLNKAIFTRNPVFGGDSRGADRHHAGNAQQIHTGRYG